MARRKEADERERAEVRLRYLLEKRDALNDEARSLRKERDRVNAKKAGVLEEYRALRDTHRQRVAAVRAHKARRDELQAEAKKLIRLKRTLKGRLRGGLESGLDRLRQDVARLEREQQTRELSLEAENRLLETLRRRRTELSELETLGREHRDVLERVQELDEAIDARFREADEAHAQVVARSEEVEALFAPLDEKRETLDVLFAESDRLHQAYLKVRERADHYHRRAAELREEVVAVREARRAEASAARQWAADQREAVREALEDDEEWEEAVDEALDHLRKGGKLEL